MSVKKPTTEVVEGQVETAQYEFNMLVTAAQVKLKFPCTFGISWKVDKEVIDTEDRVESTGSKMHLDCHMTARVILSFSWEGKTRVSHNRKNVTTLCVNYYSKSRPDETKVAGFLTIDLLKCMEGCSDRRYPLERCPDKNSYVQFSISCFKVRKVEQDQINRSSSLNKLIGSEAQGSVNSIGDQRYQSPPNKKSSEVVDGSKQKSSSSRFKKQQLNQLVQQSIKDLEKTGRDNGQRNDSKELPVILSKFKSQKELRDALQSALDDSKRQNETLKDTIDGLNKQMQEMQQRITNFETNTKKYGVAEAKLQADYDKLKAIYDEEVEISKQFQNQVGSLTFYLEEQKKKTTELKRIQDDLKAQADAKAKAKPTKQKQLQDQIDKSKRHIQNIEAKVHNLQSQIKQLQKQLKHQRQEHTKTKAKLSQKSPTKPASIKQLKTIETLEKKIAQLQSQLHSKTQRTQAQPVTQEQLNEVISMFAEKQQEVQGIYEVLEKECNKMIDIIKEKQINQQSLEEKVNLVNMELSIAFKKQEMTQRSEPEFRREEMEDSMRRSLTRMAPGANFESQSPPEDSPKALDLSRQSLVLETLETIRAQYGQKIREMSQEILRLNQIIYEQKLSQQNRQSPINYEKAHRQHEQLKYCQQNHETIINQLTVNNKILEADNEHLNQDIVALQKQIASIMSSPMAGESELQKHVNQLVETQANMALELQQLKNQLYQAQKSLNSKQQQVDMLKSQTVPQSTMPIQSIYQKLLEWCSNRTNINSQRPDEAIKNLLSHIKHEQPTIDKIELVERIRQISVEFQKLKSARLKSLQGNSQLKKQFIKSTLSIQNKLNNLLEIRGGLLASRKGYTIQTPKRMRVGRNHNVS